MLVCWTKTSKVAAEHKTYDEAMAGIDDTIKKMGLDYLDMMIIHSPQAWAKVNQSEDRYVNGNREAWKALLDIEFISLIFIFDAAVFLSIAITSMFLDLIAVICAGLANQQSNRT